MLLPCSDRCCGQLEILPIFHHRPGEPQVLGGDGDRRFPVTPSFNQTSRPAAEPVLLLTESGKDGSGAHDEQAGRQLGEHFEQLAANDLGFDKNRPPSSDNRIALVPYRWHENLSAVGDYF